MRWQVQITFWWFPERGLSEYGISENPLHGFKKKKNESHISEGLRSIRAGSIASKNFEAYNYVVNIEMP